MKDRRTTGDRPSPSKHPSGRNPKRGPTMRTSFSGPVPRERPWSVPVAITEIPDSGKHVELVADAATRAAIAKAAGLVALPRLEATFDLSRIAGEGAHVAGRVLATVEQNCVVTLDPVRSEIDETVDLDYRPSAGDLEPSGPTPLDGADPPEILTDGKIDFGAIAVEFLILGIDPYPRKPDAKFTGPVAENDPAEHPFAALAVLKKQPGGRNR